MKNKLRILLWTLAGLIIVPFLVWAAGSPYVIHDSSGIGVYTDGSLTYQAVSIATGTGEITLVTPLPVASGGTGVATLTDGGILLGSGTTDITPMGVLADGSIVVGDGTTDPVALAAFSSSTGDVTMDAGGTGASLTNDPGGVLYCGASVVAVLADGTAGKFLQSAGASAPAWEKVDLAADTDVTGTLDVPNGGTGATSLTDGGVLLGSDTGALTAMGVLADGSIIVGDGTTDPVALAVFDASTGDVNVAAGGTGVSTLTDHCVIVGSGTADVTILSVGGANEVLCGAAGADPSFRALTDTDIPNAITVGSTGTLSSPPAIGSVAAGTGAFTTLTAKASATANKVIVSTLSAAQAIYTDADTLSSGTLAITFATAFKSATTPRIMLTNLTAATAMYATSVTNTGFTAWGGSSDNFNYLAIGEAP